MFFERVLSRSCCRARQWEGAARVAVQLFQAAAARELLPAAACARELETDIFYSAECVTGN